MKSQEQYRFKNTNVMTKYFSYPYKLIQLSWQLYQSLQFGNKHQWVLVQPGRKKWDVYITWHTNVLAIIPKFSSTETSLIHTNVIDCFDSFALLIYTGRKLVMHRYLWALQATMYPCSCFYWVSDCWQADFKRLSI